MKTILMSICLLLASASFSQTTPATPETSGSGQHVMITASEVKWVEGPKSLPAGAQMAVLAGDPKVEGPFVMRLKIPAGYQIPAHTHPGDENITVISGEFRMGTGAQFKKKDLHSLPQGSFVQMKAGTQHFAAASKTSIVQLHGTGPWDIIYVNPADDPRKKNLSLKE